MARLRTIVVSCAAGATTAYFLDPQAGRSRRAGARDRLLALLRRGERRAGRLGRKVASDAQGLRRRLASRGGDGLDLTDEIVKHKIESEVLGPEHVHRSEVMVNVEGFVAVLRGVMADRDDIERLEREVRQVRGVDDVRNLIHVPGTPPPNKVAALEATRKAAAQVPPTGTAIE